VATTKGRSTQITIETSRILIIRRGRSTRTQCQECAREVDVVGLEEASVLTGMTQPALRECVGNGKWHFSESSEGALLICLDSLMKSMYAANEKTLSKGERIR